MSKTTTSHVYQSYYIFLCPFLHEQDMKIPNMTFYGSNDEILFLFLNLDMVPRNSNTGVFAYQFTK